MDRRPDHVGDAVSRARHLLLAGALALSAPAAAFEHTRFQALDVVATEAGATRRVPAMLNLPAGWQEGGPAAVLLFDPAGAPGLRDALLVALLDAGSAVLELDAATARGFSADSAANPPVPTVGSLVRDLEAARAMLRDQGAGPVVAIGYGLGGAAALLASDGPSGFAARASLGPGEAAFRGGGPDMPALPLCHALTFALGAMPTPLTFGATTAALRASGRACEAAMRPGGITRASAE